MLSYSHSGCDDLMITRDTVLVVPLPHLTLQDVDELRDILQAAVSSQWCSTATMLDKFPNFEKLYCDDAVTHLGSLILVITLKIGLSWMHYGSWLFCQSFKNYI